VTAVRYPSGAGRIDGVLKRLTGLGTEGLTLTYWEDGKVYFRFDGGLWDTATKNDGAAYGLCSWGEWGREELKCGEEKEQGERRVSDFCLFSVLGGGVCGVRG
jgi:hypothetical protein